MDDYGDGEGTCSVHLVSRGNVIICRGHEILICGNVILTCGNVIILYVVGTRSFCRGNDILMLSPRKLSRPSRCYVEGKTSISRGHEFNA